MYGEQVQRVTNASAVPVGGFVAASVLETKVRDALSREALEIHYQPLMDARTMRCAGFEALLRVPDDSGGFIPPLDFVPVAEAMGLINEIGNWVLETATRTAVAWPRPLFVSVNLSAKQFDDGTLVGSVEQALQSSGLDPGRLELEVTESVLMQNTNAIATQLATLRHMGVSIAMDDFGTGYSSLAYLWQFRFDKLKIDRSFISALDLHNQKARDILDAIIMLGHKLNMTVTAEGIETDSQAQILTELECDHFQGFLYGRPAPAEEVPAFLAKQLLWHPYNPPAVTADRSSAHQISVESVREAN